MAFKMKGSAFKLNNVATKSALKHSMNEPRTKGSAPVNKEMQKKHNKIYGEGHSNDHVTPEERRKQMEKETGLPMKSPLEQGDPMVDPKAARIEAIEGDLGTQIKKAQENIARMEKYGMTDKPGYKVQKDILAELQKRAQKEGSGANYITGEKL